MGLKTIIIRLFNLFYCAAGIHLKLHPENSGILDFCNVKVNAVIYLRVMDPNNAIIEVENYLFATSQLAQTTLRSVCGQVVRNVLERVYYIPILSPPKSSLNIFKN
jgi:hypothetical protein